MSASASLELESVLQAHGDQLATELRLLNELPQVYLTEKCVFDRGNGRIAKKRVAICSLRCCGESWTRSRSAMPSRARGRAQLWSMPSVFSEPRWRTVTE